MVITIYFIIALLMGAFLVNCSAVRDPDFRNDIQDCMWWLAVAVLALVWPVMVLQMVTLVIGRIIRAIGTIGL